MSQLVFKVFYHNELYYRAKLENGALLTLCTRQTPFHHWRVLPGRDANLIWSMYRNMKAAS